MTGMCNMFARSKVFWILLVMLLFADAEERPVFSAPEPRFAGGAMSTTMPTARLGNKGREAGGDVDMGLLLIRDSGEEPILDEM